MNESIKFVADSPTGKYAKNDTGTMVATAWSNTLHTAAVIRLSTNKYVIAPLTDIEYAGS